jgi:hypothetical protein
MNSGFVATWLAAAEDARKLVDSGRDPYAPIERMSALYRQSGLEDRAVANGLIAADLDSEDSGIRYDAMWLIREFAITSAGPALMALAGRLATSRRVGAQFELEKVERLIHDLASPKGSGRPG